MFNSIKKECSEFLKLSNGLPLLKNLNKKDKLIRREKVRMKKNKNLDLNNIINKIYKEHHNLIQRSILAHGAFGFEPIIDDYKEPCYIFPINGFKFMYTPYINDTINEYKNTLSNIPKSMEFDLFKDIIINNYSHDNLEKGLKENNEIIIYNIPYYYAVNCEYVDEYIKYFY